MELVKEHAARANDNAGSSSIDRVLASLKDPETRKLASALPMVQLRRLLGL